MLSGLNHLTLAVTDLDRSVAFYRGLLQLRLDATWDSGAYLSLPGLWLCLSFEPRVFKSGGTIAARARRSIFSIRMGTSLKPMSGICRRDLRRVAGNLMPG